MHKRKELKIFRIRCDLTQAEMAAKLNISESHYKSLERGTANPSIGLIIKFEEIFGKEPDAWKLFNNK